MRNLRRWLIRQFDKLLLMPAYFRAMAKEWLNILFGETLVGTGFLVWWALGAPTNHALVVVFVVAMFVAGYYAWRAEHIRLVPKMRLDGFFIEANSHDLSRVSQLDIEVIPVCLTDVTVRGCRGYLTGIWKWNDEEWEDILRGKSLLLRWGGETVFPENDLIPDIRKTLTLFLITSDWVLHIWSRDTPTRLQNIFALFSLHESRDIFRFDVSVVSPECPPANISLRFEITKDWMKPNISVVESQE